MLPSVIVEWTKHLGNHAHAVYELYPVYFV